jgi:hypothetical protein
MRQELALTIAQSIGLEEVMDTAIPGVLLAQRIAPMPPCAVTYCPSIVVVAQG